MAFSHPEGHHRTLLQSFAEKGWCPRQVDYLKNTFDQQVLWYLSSLGRSRFRNVSHAVCQDSTHCCAYNVDRETYEPAHTSDCSTTPGSCTFVKIDTRKLIDTIQKGKAPLISIELKKNDNTSLKITPRNHETRYIAISHVWSDGLGNPRGNALPSCQLKKLKRQVSKLKLLDGASPPPLIWIDTLCVPVEPQHSWYRKQEVKRMSSIYAGATAILALDAELQQINSRTIHDAEILARIICSVWMQRCWTLEEAVVSRLYFVQFKNKPIDPPVFLSDLTSTSTANERHAYEMLRIYLWERLQYGRTGGMRSIYHSKESLQRRRCKHPLYPSNRGIFAMPMHRHMIRSTYETLARNEGKAPSYIVPQLVRTWNELAHRSTSRVEDIYAIMASVLGFSPERIMNLETNAERLQTLIFSLPHLPVPLFFNSGPRYKQAEMHNNRWVPEEIGHYTLQGGGSMTFTDEGLHLNLQERPDIYLVAGVLSGEISFHISTESGALYEIRLFHEDSPGNDALRSRYKSVCLLLEHPLSGDTQHTRGALFRIHRTEVDGVPREKSHKDLDLIFDCPIDVSCTRSTRRVLNVKGTIKVEHTAKVLVRYDKVPDFEVLPRRPTSHMYLMFYPIIFLINTVVAVLVLLIELLLVTLLWRVHAPAQCFPTFYVISMLSLALALKELNRRLESSAYRTWLELFDYDLPEAQRSLQWKLWWNIMDEEKYSNVRWEQWGAAWRVTWTIWTRVWNVVWNHRASRGSAIKI